MLARRDLPDGAGGIVGPADDGGPRSRGCGHRYRRRPRVAHQPGQQSPAGPQDLGLGRRDGAQRGPDQLARAVPDHDPRRIDVVRGGDRGAQRRTVRVGVDRPPQGERGGVDRLRVRRPGPGRAGEIERRQRRRMAPALLVAPRQELLRDLVGRELVELPVVAEEPAHQPDVGRRALDHEEPDPEQHQRDHRRRAEDPRRAPLRAARDRPHAAPSATHGRAARRATTSRTATRGCRRTRRRSRPCSSRSGSPPATRSTATPAAAGPRPTGTAASRRPGSRTRAPRRPAAGRTRHAPACRADGPARSPAGAR